MLSLKLYVDREMVERGAVRRKVGEKFYALPSRLKGNAALTADECWMACGGGVADPCWLEIEGPRGTPASMITEIASHFLPIIAVKVRNPETGAFVSLPQGSGPIKVEDL